MGMERGGVGGREETGGGGRWRGAGTLTACPFKCIFQTGKGEKNSEHVEARQLEYYRVSASLVVPPMRHILCDRDPKQERA